VKIAYTVTVEIDKDQNQPSASTAAAVYLDALRQVLADDTFRQQGDYVASDVTIATAAGAAPDARASK
jgi:hypothetical protein